MLRSRDNLEWIYIFIFCLWHYRWKTFRKCTMVFALMLTVHFLSSTTMHIAYLKQLEQSHACHVLLVVRRIASTPLLHLYGNITISVLSFPCLIPSHQNWIHVLQLRKWILYFSFFSTQTIFNAM